MKRTLSIALAACLATAQAFAAATLPPLSDATRLTATPSGGVSAPLSALLASQRVPTNNQVCFVGDSIAFATVGQNALGIQASGGTAPYTFSVTGLPTGMTITTSSPTLWFVQGTAALGTSTVTVTATDSTAATGSQSYAVTASVSGLTITPSGAGTGTLALGNATQIHMGDSNRGPSQVVAFLTNRRVIAPQSMLFGHPGDTTAAVLARMAPIVSAGCGSYVVMIGTNDLGAVSTTALETNILSIWQQLLATGRPVVAETILPRTLSAGSTRDELWAVNRWIRKQAGTLPGLYVVDGAVAYGDPASGTATPRVGATGDGTYSYDGLHPKGIGALAAFAPVASLFNQLYPDPGYDVASFTDLYSATNTSGSLIYNPTMATTNAAFTGSIAGNVLTVTAISSGSLAVGEQIQGAGVPANTIITGYGTGGGSTGTYALSTTATVASESLTTGGTVSGRVTGTAPDAWTANTVDNGCNPCTYTVTSAASTLADGTTPADLLTISGTAGGGFATEIYLSQALTSFGNFALGDKIQATCRVEMGAGSAHITSPFLSLTYSAGSNSYVLSSGPIGSLNPSVSDGSPATAYSGTIATPLPAPAIPGGLFGTLSVSVGVYLTNSGSQTIAGSLKIGACSLRKV